MQTTITTTTTPAVKNNNKYSQNIENSNELNKYNIVVQIQMHLYFDKAMLSVIEKGSQYKEHENMRQ